MHTNQIIAISLIKLRNDYKLMQIYLFRRIMSVVFFTPQLCIHLKFYILNRIIIAAIFTLLQGLLTCYRKNDHHAPNCQCILFMYI